jgi:hypothetical protein
MSEQYVIKTSDLESEFNIGKNTRCTRLAMLGLTPDRLHKEGKSYMLTEEQYQLFRDLDAYISEHGTHRGFDRLVQLGESDDRQSAIVSVESADLDSTAVTGDFDNHYTVGSSLAQQINFNAQQRAAAIVMAEVQLADRYLQNPDALPPELRQQIDSISLRQIDPKGLAASLISGVNSLISAI